MFDIVFVDIPLIVVENNGELQKELEIYRRECRIITGHILNSDYKEKPYQYSQGILCLSSFLKTQIPQIEIGYIHYQRDMGNFKTTVLNTKVIAFSSMTITINRILSLANRAKQINPKVNIIIGGYHATYFPEEILRDNDFIDCIFLREGEKSITEYMLGNDLSTISNIAYRREDGTITINDDCMQIESRDFPIPDYSLLGNDLNFFNIQITTMRGCVGSCRFCVNRDYWCLPRTATISVIISELCLLKKVLPRKTIIHINDNIFTWDEMRLQQLYDEMKEHDLIEYFIFECDTLANMISAPIINLLHKIGIRKICLGFEDSDNNVLKFSNKPVTFEQNVNGAKLIKRIAPDICVYAYWLIGLPGSTKSSMEYNLRSINYILNARIVDIISPKIFIPYPGTVFFNNPKEYGIMNLQYDWDLYERRKPPYPYSYKQISNDMLYEYLIKTFRICHNAYKNIWGNLLL